MGIQQRIIQEKIDNEEIIVKCLVTDMIKGTDGYYHGFRFEKPYDNISHGLSNIGYEYSKCYNCIRRKMDK